MSYGRGRGWQALGQGLQGIGQTIRDQEREQALAAERQGVRDTETERFNTGLRMTPGVYESPDQQSREIDLSAPPLSAEQPAGMPSPELQNPFDEPPPRSALEGAAADFAPSQLEAPDLSPSFSIDEPTTLDPGHTRLTGGAEGLAFNPRHEQEQQQAEQERLRTQARSMFIALGRDEDEADALATAEMLKIDPAYKPLSRDEMVTDAKEFAGIDADEAIRQRQAPQWQGRDPAELVQSTEGEFNWVVPPPRGGDPDGTGVVSTGVTGRHRTTGTGTGNPPARTMLDANRVLELVRESPEYAELSPEEQTEIAREIYEGSREMPEPAPEPEPEGPGWFKRSLGGIGNLMRRAGENARDITTGEGGGPMGAMGDTAPGGGLGGVRKTVVEMQDSGMSEDEIIAELKRQGLIQP